MTDDEVRRALRQLPRQRAGDDFTARVLERLPPAEEHQGARPLRRTGWAGIAVPEPRLLLAAAAALLVAMVAAWTWLVPAGETPATRGPAPETVTLAADAPSRSAESVTAAAELPRPAATPAAAERDAGARAVARDRAARLEALLAEQRRLRREIGDLRHLVEASEPLLLLDADDGVGLILPAGGQSAGSRRPGRGPSPAVRVVPAKLTAY